MGYAERMSRHETVLLTGGDYIWHAAAIQDALDADAEIAALRAERDEAKTAATEASTALADALARVEALEAGLREIEGWAPNWPQGVDENIDAIREHARALLEEKS